MCTGMLVWLCMTNNILDGANPSEPVHTGSHTFAEWLTVQDAVSYCLSKGLARTPKTVRKWAQRAIESAPGTAEISVQRQDTENGFRWLISRESLDVKIEQEKDLAVRTDAEQGGAHLFEQVHTGSHTSEQVPTGANMFEHVPTNREEEATAKSHENTSEQVPAGARPKQDELIEFLKKQLERAEKQNDVKDKQIDALLERDRETNVLIQGLQTSLTGVVNALPSGRREERHDAPRHSAHQTEQTTTIRDA